MLYGKTAIVPAFAGRVYKVRRQIRKNRPQQSQRDVLLQTHNARRVTYYEVFKAPKETRCTGEPYDRYPSTEQFGFGTALCIRGGEKHTADKIAFYMSNGFEAGRFRA